MWLSRRRFVALLGTAPLATGLLASADALPEVTVHRNPSCGCCGAWAAHLRHNGFAIKVVDTGELEAIKQHLGVPNELASCHTAEVGGYVVEGHVPAGAIKRLLAETPRATGLAVPGMPAGSPGMEGGTPETYDVVLFGDPGRRVFARYQGDREL